MVIGPDRRFRAEPPPPIGLVPSGVEGQGPPDQRESGSDLTLPPDSRFGVSVQPKAGFGRLGSRTKFGTNGRRTILRSGGCFSACKVPSREVMFLTGTLPGGTFEAKLAIAAHSSWVVHQLKEWLKQFVVSAWSLYVWELQKRGALHIHYAVWVPDAGSRIRIWARFKGWWFDLMTRLSQRAGVDVFERAGGRGTWANSPDVVQADVQVCRKCPSAYISKYVSKGKSKSHADVGPGDVGEPWPVQWWGVSRPLQAKMRELSFVTEVTDLNRRQVEDVRERLERLLDTSYYRKHEVSPELREGALGPCYQYTSRCRGITVTTAYGDYHSEASMGEVLGLPLLSRVGNRGRHGRSAASSGSGVGCINAGGDGALGPLGSVVESELAAVCSREYKMEAGGGSLVGVEGDDARDRLDSVQLPLQLGFSEDCGSVRGGGGSWGRKSARGRKVGAKPVAGRPENRSFRIFNPDPSLPEQAYLKRFGKWFSAKPFPLNRCRMGPRPHWTGGRK